ncbi:MAG: outer membrane protein assembly factor [Gammaproteobacteria bacterium]|nr:outer membrane protein assembly factor [Gammaproteobacteria bacterium]
MTDGMWRYLTIVVIKNGTGVHLCQIACLLFVLFLPTFGHALPMEYVAPDSKVRAPVESTLPARRLAQLQTTEGYAFWARRLQRDGRKALESLGYYSAEVRVKLDSQNSVRVEIDPGLPTVINEVKLAFHGYPGDALPVSLGLQRADQLDHGLYESGKRRLHSWLLAHGYLNAALTEHRIEVNRKKRTADIRLVWDVGPLFRFGDTRFLDTTLNPDFLQRYVQHQQGSPLSEKDLQALSQNLRNSGYFSNVEIAPLVGEANSDWLTPVQIKLTPVKRSVYEAGVSVGTDRGPGVDAGITRRQSNAQGHRWEARIDVSARRQFIAGRYEMPSATQMDRTRLLDFNVVNEETDSTRRTTIRTALSLQKRWRGWRRTDAINVLNEHYTVSGDKRESTMLIGSAELFRRESNDAVNPTHGWRARGELSASSTLLGSATDFVRAEINGKFIGSIGDKSRWLLRGRIGSMWTADFADVPASLRFFAGGDYSVRGFDYESLGPRDDANNVVGGVHVIETSIELDRLLTPKWRIALFADAGNAFGDGRESLEYAAGAGVRWLSPVGPLRLDIAAPLSESDGGMRIHFSAGPDL